eukprot:15977-Heterococcus_DN1.PRE.3
MSQRHAQLCKSERYHSHTVSTINSTKHMHTTSNSAVVDIAVVGFSWRAHCLVDQQPTTSIYHHYCYILLEGLTTTATATFALHHCTMMRDCDTSSSSIVCSNISALLCGYCLNDDTTVAVSCAGV